MFDEKSVDDEKTTLPAWFEAARTEIVTVNEAAQRQLELQSFDIAFESVLEHVASGKSLNAFCRAYHLPISSTRYRAWLYSDPSRKEKYRLAQKLAAEAAIDDIIRIADGLDADGNATMDDVPRSTLKINTRKFVAQVMDRERFGDLKTVNTTVTTVDEESVKKLSTVEIRQMLMRQTGSSDAPPEDIFDVELDDPLATP
jgi:hypothetical protein